MQMKRREAAGKVAGALSYVLSDATVDRYGDVIEPQGWLLDHFRSNPIALFNHSPHQPIGKWANIRVEDDRLVADFVPAKKGTSQRTDEILSLIAQDILRATSVGFRPITQEPLNPKRPMDGTRFTSQELMETSIVSVPANPSALQIAKSLNISDDTLSVVFAGSGGMKQRDITTSGGHARQQSPTAGIKMNITKQIEDVQTKLNVARDELSALVQDPEHDENEADALQADIGVHTTRLASLERSEKALAARALVQNSEIKAAPAFGRRPLSLPAKEVAPRDLYYRAAAVQFRSYVRRQSIDDVLNEYYPDHEATAIFTKAAVAGATTTQAGWASELVQQANADFLSNLDPNAIFPRLAGLGTSLTFGPGGGSIKIPSRATTPSISGSFVAESQPIPVRRLGLTSITLLPTKVGVISVFSREIAMYSNPQIESIIREGINDDTAITLDTLLLDAVAGSATRPAGLTNGVAALTATAGGGSAAILGDLKKLAAPFYAANAGRQLVLIVNPAEALSMSMTPGPDGNFGWTSQFTSRFTVLESTTVPAGHIYLVDAADFVAVNGAPEFDVSETATLHMEDTTPLNIGVAGSPATIAAPTQSMFQTAQIAIRMVASISWAMRRTGMVSHIAGVTW